MAGPDSNISGKTKNLRAGGRRFLGGDFLTYSQGEHLFLIACQGGFVFFNHLIRGCGIIFNRFFFILGFFLIFQVKNIIEGG